MTRMEVTNKRDLKFSNWMRKSLPDSKTGWIASDIDFYIYNHKTKIHGMIELKSYMSNLTYPQTQMYPRLNKWISEGGAREGWHYAGFFLIQFEKEFFDDGKIYLNGKESSEDAIIEILSLNDIPNGYEEVPEVIQEQEWMK